MDRIKVIELKNEKNIAKITKDYNLNELKAYQNVTIVIDGDFLNINKCLFGKNEKETKCIQKNNYKQLKLAYKKIAKIIKFLKKNNIKFNNAIYIDIDKKFNTNDKMLEFMINCKHIKNPLKKLEDQIAFTCDYLDSEVKINNICQFENGKCIKYRDSKENSSCCKANCKYGFPCSIKNIACKIFMCDLIKSMGYVFYVEYIFSLRKNLTIIDRLICKTCLFLPLKKVMKIFLIERIIVGVFISLMFGFIFLSFI